MKPTLHLAALVALVLAATLPAHADVEADGLMLARICAHEAGWNSDATGDCAAIHEVLYRGAAFRDLSYRTLGRSYSGRLLRGETTRRYYAELDRDGRQPPSWPVGGAWVSDGRWMRRAPGPDWANYRDSWLELLAHAEALVARHPDDVSPCAQPVDDWGGAMDAARADRLGLVQVDCGETRNLFYARPSRLGVPTPASEVLGCGLEVEVTAPEE